MISLLQLLCFVLTFLLGLYFVRKDRTQAKRSIEMIYIFGFLLGYFAGIIISL